MLLNDRAQQRGFLAANESALTAHGHHTARTFNGNVQNSSILLVDVRMKKSNPTGGITQMGTVRHLYGFVRLLGSGW